MTIEVEDKTKEANDEEKLAQIRRAQELLAPVLEQLQREDAHPFGVMVALVATAVEGWITVVADPTEVTFIEMCKQTYGWVTAKEPTNG